MFWPFPDNFTLFMVSIFLLSLFSVIYTVTKIVGHIIDKKPFIKSSAPIRAKWGPKAAVLITIAIYFGAQLLAGLLIALYPLSKHWSYDQTKQWLGESITGQFGFVAVVELVTLWLLWQFLRLKKAKLADIGLIKPRLKDAVYALVGYGNYFLLYIGIVQLAQLLIPSLDIEQKQEIAFSTATTGPALGLVFLGLVILPPITEEIVVRGFLYTGLRSRFKVAAAAIITSFLFAIAHLQGGIGSTLLWIAAIDTFVLSLVLVYLREKTSGLAAPIGLHMIKNGIAFAALFIFKIQ